jgi:hypothetical protein
LSVLDSDDGPQLSRYHHSTRSAQTWLDATDGDALPAIRRERDAMIDLSGLPGDAHSADDLDVLTVGRHIVSRTNGLFSRRRPEERRGRRFYRWITGCVLKQARVRIF